MRQLRSGARVLVAAFAVAIGGSGAFAAESASGAYVLGLRGPGAGVTPPPGVFFSNQFFVYRGDISGAVPFDRFTLEGRAKLGAAVNIPTVLVVTPVEILGGRLGVSATVPFGRASVKGNLGPSDLTDSLTTFADPSFGASLGWKAGDVHFQLGATIFAPVGDHREGRLANIAKHRGALDVSGALTWLEPTFGLDVTNIVGVTFNRQNEATDYRTGTEFHWDWSVTKKFGNGVSIGPSGYVYKQLTADSGPGARLGGFKGEVWAVGAGVGHEFKLGKVPVTARVRWFHEVQTERRLRGDAVFLGLSMPLWVPGR